MKRHTTVLRDSSYPTVPGCGAIYDCRSPLRRKSIAVARRSAVLAPALALLALVALQSCQQPVKAQPAPAPPYIEQAAPIPKGVCRAGFVGVWIDHATVQCLREF